MATYFLSPISTVLQAFTNQGVILAGGSISTFLAGTSTPTNTWTDITGGVLNSNPITLDSAGRPPSMIWQQSRVPIKAVFKDSSGVQVGPTYDQISGIGDPGTALQSFFGTDSGAANAYIITVANSNFTSYVDGLVIYWTPTHSNTSASTVNINGLGVVNLLAADGTSALSSGALVAGSPVVMLSSGGVFILMSSGATAVVTGSFVPAWTGFSVAPTGTSFWTKVGGMVTVSFGTNGTGTSNSTGMSFSNLPTAIRPSTGTTARVPCVVTDNGAEATGAVGFSVPAGTVVFYKGTAPPSSSGFTNPGTKGMGFGTSFTYPII